MDQGPRLDIRLLGELTVLVDETVVPIPGRQQRGPAHLAGLSREPRHPRRTVDRGAVGTSATVNRRDRPSRLGLEGAQGVGREHLVTRARHPARRLPPAVSESETDLGRFRALVAEAGRVDAPMRARSTAVAGTLPVARSTTTGTGLRRCRKRRVLALMELHDLAVGDRIDCDLETGRHRQLVPELEALVAEAPLRERPHAQLMRALSGSGRQAEALAVYRRLRTRLVDDLGMEPSADCRISNAPSWPRTGPPSRVRPRRRWIRPSDRTGRPSHPRRRGRSRHSQLR